MKKYTVYVTYEGFDRNKDDKLERLAGRDFAFSGYGLGVREVGFEFKDKRAAYRRAEKIRRSFHRISAVVQAE